MKISTNELLVFASASPLAYAIYYVRRSLNGHQEGEPVVNMSDFEKVDSRNLKEFDRISRKAIEECAIGKCRENIFVQCFVEMLSGEKIWSEIDNADETFKEDKKVVMDIIKTQFKENEPLFNHSRLYDLEEEENDCDYYLETLILAFKNILFVTFSPCIDYTSYIEPQLKGGFKGHYREVCKDYYLNQYQLFDALTNIFSLLCHDEVNINLLSLRSYPTQYSVYELIYYINFVYKDSILTDRKVRSIPLQALVPISLLSHPFRENPGRYYVHIRWYNLSLQFLRAVKHKNHADLDNAKLLMSTALPLPDSFNPEDSEKFNMFQMLQDKNSKVLDSKRLSIKDKDAAILGDAMDEHGNQHSLDVVYRKYPKKDILDASEVQLNKLFHFYMEEIFTAIIEKYGKNLDDSEDAFFKYIVLRSLNAIYKETKRPGSPYEKDNDGVNEFYYIKACLFFQMYQEHFGPNHFPDPKLYPLLVNKKFYQARTKPHVAIEDA